MLAKTASSGSRPLSISNGTSDSWTGMNSARPSLMAARAFGPMKSALWKRWPSISGARCGWGPSQCR